MALLASIKKLDLIKSSFLMESLNSVALPKEFRSLLIFLTKRRVIYGEHTC